MTHRKQMAKNHPELNLERYDNCWPIRDMLKMHLKYRSEAARRDSTRLVAKRARAVVNPES